MTEINTLTEIANTNYERLKAGNLDNLASLTLVICSYERAYYLTRQVTFWWKFPCSILIADGSKVKNEQVSQLCQLRSETAKYFHMPKAPLLERLNRLSKSIDTDYAMMLADDDLMLPRGVSELIDGFTNNEVVGVAGKSLSFEFSPQKKISYKLAYSFAQGQLTGSQADRTLRSLDPYTGICTYAVYRSGAWSASWGNYTRSSWSSSAVTEIRQTLIAASLGNILFKDILYWMLSAEEPPVDTADSKRTVSFRDWYKAINGINPEELDAFENELRKYWPGDTGLEVVKSALNGYMNNRPEKKSDRIAHFLSLARFLLNFLKKSDLVLFLWLTVRGNLFGSDLPKFAKKADLSQSEVRIVDLASKFLVDFDRVGRGS